MLSCMSSLYILDMNLSSSELLFANIICHSVNWFFVLLAVSFAGQKLRSGKINYIEENIDSKFMDFGLREHFMNFTQKAREVKTKINE